MKKLTWMIGILCALAVLAGCAGGGKPSDESSVGSFDPSELPFYTEDIEDLTYTYGDREMLQPYWMGNVICNEQLMIVEKEGVTEGHLLYQPERILSVRDWSLEKEYTEGVDYLISGRTLTLPEGSAIPVFRDEWSRGRNVPEAYPEGNAGTGYQMIGEDGTVMYTETGLIWRNYIHVSYVYDPADVDRTKVKAFGEELYGLTQMLRNKQTVNMTVFGDSISEGHSSSGLWSHAPCQPPYAKLVAEGLREFGGAEVNLTNLSVGGKDSNWAADDLQIAALTASDPDFLILAFGTNDSMNDLVGSRYRANIEKIIDAVKTVNSECQILLVAPFPSHEKVKSARCHELICQRLQEIAAETGYLDIGYVSMYEGCLEMLKVKQYYELAGNNANHPNDFIHRFYAMNILSAVIDFEALGK